MQASVDSRRFATQPAETDGCANFADAEAAAMEELAAGLKETTSQARGTRPPQHAVAIPVRNEAHRIVACIDALAAQHTIQGQPFRAGQIHVVLLFNNCTDDSYALVKSRLARWPIAITAYDMVLPEELCCAGHARRLANHAALRGLPCDGVLFMTDADSRVPPDWIGRYAALIRGGCDAVAGTIELSPDDRDDIPPSLMHRIDLEARYEGLLDELESIVDPIACDPWPRHYGASGANIAVRAGAMRMLDGFPDVACGEDRRLMALLERNDHRIRHDTQTRVLTSGRLFGRAVGGKADTLRHRVLVPEAACDERLECAKTALRRAALRSRLRSLWQQPEPADVAIDALATEAGLAPASLWRLHATPHFGEAWSLLESHAAGLQRQAIHPSRLVLEIERCKEMIEALRGAGASARACRELIA